MIQYYKDEWVKNLKLKGDEPFLLWGMSSFTSFVWEGGVCVPDLHFKRIVEGAKYLNMRLPDYNSFLKALYEIQKKSDEMGVNAKIRLTWVQESKEFFFWIRFEEYNNSVNKSPYSEKSLGLCELTKEEYSNPARFYKIGNYGHHRNSYSKRGQNDDVLLIHEGKILEATMASVFSIGSQGVSISNSERRLESVAEYQIINFLKYKYEIEYGANLDALLSNKERRWYYCNSIQGVVPVGAINGHVMAQNKKEAVFFNQILFFSKKRIKTLVSCSQLSIIDLTEVARD
jgi:branched-subunit amino acid aminotransferase/4-amino-4-deoxychorismate lyase